MSWRFVLECKSFGSETIESLRDIAIRLGYKFIMWNSQVYYVGIHKDRMLMETGITIEDMV